ncbi:MAG: S9 family peptidase [Candidatus Krumholzibacteria bacterium]|nr:S9 family peptidase [Candidatus Krumholzibacteria bacterium]
MRYLFSRIPVMLLLLSLYAVAVVMPAGAHDGEINGDPHALTFDDLISLGRIGSFEISPDAKLVAFTVTWFDRESNSSNTDIYMVRTDGGQPWNFVRSGGSDYAPCWSPDGKELAFVSDREGSSQIWLIPTGGGEARRVTDIPTGVSDPLWSPDGRTLAFTSRVYPDCEDMDCNAEKLDEWKNSKVRARLIDHLMFRHWNSWREGRWNHLFLTNIDSSSLVEINRGMTDVPPISLGGERDYDFSPDGNEICYSMNPDPMVAISTNNDIYIRSVTDGTTTSITSENPSNDNNPRYSPDGRYIAYRAQMKPGFEADRYRLMLYDRREKKTLNLTEDFDYGIGNFDWSPDSRSIFFSTQDRGRYSICRVSIRGTTPEKVITGGYDNNLRISADGRKIVFARQSVDRPTDLYTSTIKGKKITRLTDINAHLLAHLSMNPLEEFWFDGAATKIHGMIVKPPFFEEGKKYPVIVLIHGGPQGAFGDNFHYRWNVQMFASPGYVVATFNFTGSTGYGQAFTDAISGDWGGAPYIDIMNGLDYIIENFDYIDPARIGAAGASYGGYMVDWIEGHNDRFKCLVSHAGVYNLESMYGATEELWFPEWEFGGMPWTSRETYEKFSPHRFVAEFKTPCLVVHGEHDYRVPYTQGLEFFTALQRQGVPSKLLFFPDEDHFVRKPQNAELWWNTLYDWFEEYLRE